MSYMRHPVYAWDDGVFIHLWARNDQKDAQAFHQDHDGYPDFDGGIAMKLDVFDVLVLFRYAELVGDRKRLKKVVKLARKEGGNFGSFDFLEVLGEDPMGEFKRRMDEVTANRDRGAG